ncbi:hypothetical protein N7539_008049 [Penicillium diatomitis]|uniref:NAD(P)-binding protein n=1 Tax=Penicillium diatomitis TaxID=2819901 RepID=A0A9W9WTK3_9EURO|nr:uncharacterized protein N7539_008049 [Penicillium diatomitis]KAJ5474983.1 hypothetical protein N7539_008049 [Penicillium diatomitis]
MSKVAVITGGTSGIGLDVAKDLAESGDWRVKLIGSNSQRGQEAARSIQKAEFCQADVAKYIDLAKVFDSIFAEFGRIDFVFANAGVAELEDFFAAQPDAGIPPEPPLGLMQINLDGAVNTVYLAMHYFRRSSKPLSGMKNLILTSSIGGLYPCARTPVYSATKHGIVGLTRSIADKLWQEGVRVNAICPGVVKPALLTDELEALSPQEVQIPIQYVTGLVRKLLAGDDLTDGKGCTVPSSKLFSKTLHISHDAFFFIDQPEFHDESGRLTWEAMMERWKTESS